MGASGSATHGYRLTDRYTRDSGTVFMTGIQALARLPIEQLRADRQAGLQTAAFVSGYPGSPLGGFDAEIARAARTVGDLPITCRPALNEEYAERLRARYEIVIEDAEGDGDYASISEETR